MGLLNDIAEAFEIKIYKESVDELMNINNIESSYKKIINYIVESIKNDNLSLDTAKNIVDDIRREYINYVRHSQISHVLRQEKIKYITELGV